MSQSVDLIVVGAGVVGLCAAIAMRQRGYSVAVLEAGSFDVDLMDSGSRVYAINQASQALFQAIGVWDTFETARIAPYDHMHVWESEKQVKIDFDARMIARDQLGVMLEESVIKSALIQKARALEIDLIANWQLQTVEEYPTAIVLRSIEQQWSAQWLIVADGARSPTRQCLGVPMVTWSYHQKAIVAKVRTEKSHQRTAYQIFCAQGPLAFLPLAHQHESSIVWSTGITHANDLMALPKAVFAQQLAEAFEHKLGHITILSACRAFPLHMQHVKRYTGQRWLLMGDAAHTIHPMAGLGLNIGLADLAMWLQLLPENTQALNKARILRTYQRQRKHALWQMIVFLQVLHVLFTNSSMPLSLLRGIGITLCNHLPEAKRMLIEHATGLS